MNKKIKIGILIVLVIIALFGIYYINDYYHVQKTAIDCLENNSDVLVVKTSNGLLFDGKGNESALIFYP